MGSHPHNAFILLEVGWETCKPAALMVFSTISNVYSALVRLC